MGPRDLTEGLFLILQTGYLFIFFVMEMKQIVDLAKIKGFVYQGSEIYGGLANTWDYGPYGATLKENIKNAWIKNFVQKRTDMVLLDAAILMNPQVWVASGHVGGFSDPLIDDKLTKERFRADKLLENLIEDKQKEMGVDAAKEYFVSKYNVVNLVPEKLVTRDTGAGNARRKSKKPKHWKRR